MNTLLLSYNTLLIKTCAVVTNPSSIQKVTTCCDVKLVKIICCTIVTVVAIITVAAIIWHLIDKIIECLKEQKSIEQEERSKKFSLAKEYRGRILDFMKERSGKESSSMDEKYISQINEYIDSI